MTEPLFEDRPGSAGLPEIVDDDSPERDRYPEPEEPTLPSDEGYPGSASVGTTVREQLEGESLDRRLGQERPEPQVDPLAPLEVDESLDVSDLPEDADAGQLVAPDGGGREDAEKDEVATELPDAYDVTQEERAMRVVEPGPG